MAIQPRCEITDRLTRGTLWRTAGSNAVRRPLAEDQFHDRLTPSRAGDRRARIGSVAATADERGIADSSRSFVDSAARRGCSGNMSADINSYGAHSIV